MYEDKSVAKFNCSEILIQPYLVIYKSERISQKFMDGKVSAIGRMQNLGELK